MTVKENLKLRTLVDYEKIDEVYYEMEDILVPHFQEKGYRIDLCNIFCNANFILYCSNDNDEDYTFNTGLAVVDEHHCTRSLRYLTLSVALCLLHRNADYGQGMDDQCRKGIESIILRELTHNENEWYSLLTPVRRGKTGSGNVTMVGVQIENSYGDNYTVQAGATVIAGGAEKAMERKRQMEEQSPSAINEHQERCKELWRVNRVFRRMLGDKEVDAVKLYDFIKEHFAGSISKKYEWMALYIFAANKNQMQETDFSVFAEQMCSEEWFGKMDAKLLPTADAIGDYSFLIDKRPSSWDRNLIPKSSKATETGINRILRRYDALDLEYDVKLILTQ